MEDGKRIRKFREEGRILTQNECHLLCIFMQDLLNGELRKHSDRLQGQGQPEQVSPT